MPDKIADSEGAAPVKPWDASMPRPIHLSIIALRSEGHMTLAAELEAWWNERRASPAQDAGNWKTSDAVQAAFTIARMAATRDDNDLLVDDALDDLCEAVAANPRPAQDAPEALRKQIEALPVRGRIRHHSTTRPDSELILRDDVLALFGDSNVR